LKKFLKHIHNFFLLLGINISFVKKSNNNGASALEHNSQTKMNDFFSNPQTIKEYLEPARLQFYRDIVQLFDDEKIEVNGKTLADVGCGTGHLLKYINNKMTPSLNAGFDFSEAALNVAKTIFPKADYKVHDLYKLLPESFDIILCTEVLEHLQYPDEVITNLINRLNPNGILFLTVPNGRLDSYYGHINFWSPESWHVFLSKNSMKWRIKTGLFNETVIWGTIYKNNDKILTEQLT
jgi:2-polyprenyl-3-methyl-5-hydroxy-6-metoxy-1,4-benzoquinol methylase